MEGLKIYFVKNDWGSRGREGMIETLISFTIISGDLCWLSAYIYVDEKFWTFTGYGGLN